MTGGFEVPPVIATEVSTHGAQLGDVDPDCTDRRPPSPVDGPKVAIRTPRRENGRMNFECTLAKQILTFVV
jgi:hypothetical protein